ncbi:unnamed protein product [Polarella glacialis]|uniref:Uncharacterized protein n=1 Tax=Polarella glacialis TaxID=89957 RepID=A0A813LUR9_POLGL|nr:unnamed protein product [Polarella glacialis]
MATSLPQDYFGPRGYGSAKGKTLPKWEDFEEEHAVEIDMLKLDIDLPKLTGEMLSKAAKKRRIGAVGGLDAWRTCEFRILPPEVLDPLAEILEDAENGAGIPDVILKILQPLIDKGEGPAPLKQRGIGLLSVVHAAYASARNVTLHQHVALAFPTEIVGGMNGRTASEHIIATSLVYGAAAAGLQHCVGLFLDRIKCFDLLLKQILLPLMKRVGIPMGIINYLECLTGNMVRMFVLGKWVGEPWQAVNGWCQGCAITVYACNLLFSVLNFRLRNATPNVRSCQFVDDQSIDAPFQFRAELVKANTEVMLFHDRCGQDCNEKKTNSTGTDEAGRKWVAMALPMCKVAVHIEGLGVDINTTATRCSPVMTSRFEKTIPHYEKIGNLPVTRRDKAELVAAKCATNYSWGAAVTIAPAKVIAAQRSATTRAVWGSARKLMCVHLVLTFIYKGHQIDPEQVMPYVALTEIFRFLRQAPSYHELWAEIFTARSEHRRKSGDSVEVVFHVCDAIKWKWNSPFEFELPNGATLRILEASVGRIQHTLRQALRVAQWKCIPHVNGGEMKRGRKDMLGVGDSDIDTAATMALYRGSTPCKKVRGFLFQAQKFLGHPITPWEAANLASLIVGSTLHRRRLFSMSRPNKGFAKDPICMFCGLEDEECSHMWLGECIHDPSKCDVPVVKAPWHKYVTETVAKAAPCMINCGIKLVDPTLQEMTCALEREASEAASSLPMVPDPTLGGVQCSWEEGYLIAWGDGAAIFVGLPLIQRAGFSLFFALNHHSNLKARVVGPDQTNIRGELCAMVTFAKIATCKSWGRSDCEWVVLRLNILLRSKSVKCPSRWDHADLFNVFLSLENVRKQQREGGWLRYSWVKGHAEEDDIRKGRSTDLDRWGNDHADKLAGKGALMHTVTGPMTEEYLESVRVTILYQALMLKKWLARAEHMKLHGITVFDINEDEAEEPEAEEIEGAGAGASTPTASQRTDSYSAGASASTPTASQRAGSYGAGASASTPIASQRADPQQALVVTEEGAPEAEEEAGGIGRGWHQRFRNWPDFCWGKPAAGDKGLILGPKSMMPLKVNSTPAFDGEQISLWCLPSSGTSRTSSGCRTCSAPMWSSRWTCMLAASRSQTRRWFPNPQKSWACACGA